MTPPDRDDDKTQLVPQPGVDQDKTIVSGRGGNAGLEVNWPSGGKVVGTNIQAGVRVAGQPQPQGQPPAAPFQGRPAGGQGETIFVIPQQGQQPGAPVFNPVVAWLTVLKGPGRGQSRPVFYGQNSIGRGPDQRVSLDFGEQSDQRISRGTHAYLVYDEVSRKFFLRDAGQSNLVRHNGNVVLQPIEIEDRDEVTIGDTKLMFVALCNSKFDWLAEDEPSTA